MAFVIPIIYCLIVIVNLAKEIKSELSMIADTSDRYRLFEVDSSGPAGKLAIKYFEPLFPFLCSAAVCYMFWGAMDQIWRLMLTPALVLSSGRHTRIEVLEQLLFGRLSEHLCIAF